MVHLFCDVLGWRLRQSGRPSAQRTKKSENAPSKTASGGQVHAIDSYIFCDGHALVFCWLKPRGASGKLRRRILVASKMALAMAGARPTMGVSPAPAGGRSLRSRRMASI